MKPVLAINLENKTYIVPHKKAAVICINVCDVENYSVSLISSYTCKYYTKLNSTTILHYNSWCRIPFISKDSRVYSEV